MRTTAAAITPIAYIRLQIATAIGVFIIGDPIGGPPLMGGLTIILSELLHWRSERNPAPFIAA